MHRHLSHHLGSIRCTSPHCFPPQVNALHAPPLLQFPEWYCVLVQKSCSLHPPHPLRVSYLLMIWAHRWRISFGEGHDTPAGQSSHIDAPINPLLVEYLINAVHDLILHAKFFPSPPPTHWNVPLSSLTQTLTLHWVNPFSPHLGSNTPRRPLGNLLAYTCLSHLD